MESIESIKKMNKFYKILMSCIVVLILVTTSAATVIDSTTILELLNIETSNINGVNFTDSLHEDYSYLIYTDGVTTYAKNGDTGKIDYNGTNAALIIQLALNEGKSGNYFIKSGDYYITQQIQLNNSNVSIIGENSGRRLAKTTQLIINANIESILYINGSQSDRIYNTNIENIRFTQNGNSGMGIISNFTFCTTIFNNEFDGFQGTGVLITNVWVANFENNLINFNGHTESTPSVIINASYDKNTDVMISNNLFEANNNTDILISNSHYSVINQNYFEGKYQTYHIYTDTQATGTIISNNFFYELQPTGVHIYCAGVRSIISNNRILENGTGIRIFGQYSQVNNNYIYNTKERGIKGEGHYQHISGNILQSCGVNGGVSAMYPDSYSIVSGNSIYSATYAGITVSNRQYMLVTDNIISSSNRAIAEGGTADNNYIANNYFLSATVISAKADSTIAKNNHGVAPFNFGNCASAPTPYGAGDEHYNTTDNIKYCYNGSAWNALY